MTENREKELTLADLLESRENRVAYQKELMEKFGGVLVSFTLNIPGPVKDGPSYRAALYEGMDRMKSSLEGMGGVKLYFMQNRWLPTGPEGYFCVNRDEDHRTPEEVKALALQVKRAAVEIEERDRLGRLFDMDVITKEGSIGRGTLGAAPRKCLLCGEDAKVCARGRHHSMEELLAEIAGILEEAGL